MTHASLFSGIGGPEVAAAMLGWTNAFHCEINDFGRTVLEYWFPNSKSYADIKTTDFTPWRGQIDVLTGGFPCQPFSYAGKRRGADDDRYLWPHMLHAIEECRPAWVVGENVLESSRWSSKARLLQWKVKPLCSVRITEFSDTDRSNPSPSNASAVTLRALDMPSNRCLFQLAPLELPIEETEFSSSLMLKTPCGWDCKEMKSWDTTGNLGTLGQQAMMGKFNNLLPTLTAIEGEKYTSETAGETSRLSPLFTEEMMGFPSMWTTLPFLSKSGETNPSKPTATP